MTRAHAEYPVLDPDERAFFELSDKAQRIGNIEPRRQFGSVFQLHGRTCCQADTWDRVSLNADFIGSCWAHSARFFELMRARSLGELY